MKIDAVPYVKTGFFSKLIVDFLEKKLDLNKKFRSDFQYSDLEDINFVDVGQKTDRSLLKNVVLEQYGKIDLGQVVKGNIEALEGQKTFTITTAHQPNIFTGPLYFIYKIISAINLAEQLNKEFIDKHFVPVYWMGSEDHDFAEINHINTYGKRVEWNIDAQHKSVGKLNSKSLNLAIDELEQILGNGTHARNIIAILRKCYLESTSLSQATRKFVHHLFSKYGLVIIDGDDKKLKAKFKKIVLSDAFDNMSYDIVSKFNKVLGGMYHIQVSPREINSFYINENGRNRIVKSGEKYQVLNTEISFSREEFENEVEQFPERFSPNVVLRPLYQEMTLPNVAYVGGGGELAYWLQLQDVFEYYDIPYPNLVLRSSVLWLDGRYRQKFSKLGISAKDLFRSIDELVKYYVDKHSDENLDMQQAEKLVGDAFDSIRRDVVNIDPTLESSLEAEKTRSLSSLKALEGKANKAIKRKHEEGIEQLKRLYNSLFPDNGLQERHDNFLQYYNQYGDMFIEMLKQHLNPLQKEFLILEEDC